MNVEYEKICKMKHMIKLSTVDRKIIWLELTVSFFIIER